MKKTLFLIMLLLCTSLTVSAEKKKGERSNEDREAQRKEMVLRQANSLAERMNLDGTTAEWFVPLYQEYSQALQDVRKDAMPDKDKKIDELSDLDAEQMILDNFKAEEQQVAVKRAYYNRFKERLTAQQLVKVFTMVPGEGRGNRKGNANGDRGGFPGGPGGGFPGGGFPGGGFPGGGPF